MSLRGMVIHRDSTAATPRPISRRALAIGAAIGIVLASACTTATDPIPVSQINILPQLDSVEAGSVSQGFNVTLLAQNGQAVTGRTVQWSTSDPSIATVDATGKVHGLTTGQVIVTATADNRSATSTVRVIIPVSQIQVSPKTLSLPVTISLPIHADLVGPNGEAITGRTISWASANPSIATVNTTGVVTGVSTGQTSVTVHAGSQTVTVPVTVADEPVVSVTISPAVPVQIIRLSQGFQFTATCFGPSGPLQGRVLQWSSNNPSVATVNSNGLVSGLAIGQAVITADCEQKTDQVTVQITPVPVSTVTISPPSLTMQVGQLQQLSIVAKDSAGNTLSLIQPPRSTVWTSDNLLVASVTGAGVVGASMAGVAHIQVTIDGVASNVVDVTVQNVPVATVQVSSPTLQPKVGTPTQLMAILRDANGNQLSTSGRQITWTSSDASVATVSINGLVNPLSAGAVTIQATCEGQIGFVQLTVVP
jgi:uncharacterized protein YjdB